MNPPTTPNVRAPAGRQKVVSKGNTREIFFFDHVMKTPLFAVDVAIRRLPAVIVDIIKFFMRTFCIPTDISKERSVRKL